MNIWWCVVQVSNKDIPVFKIVNAASSREFLADNFTMSLTAANDLFRVMQSSYPNAQYVIVDVTEEDEL